MFIHTLKLFHFLVNHFGCQITDNKRRRNFLEQAEKDRQLVKQFQKGDMSAFSQFIQCYQDRLYRIALVKLHVKSLAEDAVQEAFLRALKGLSHFRFGAKPFT